MCGLCGLLRLNPEAGHPNTALLEAMNLSLAHRGPSDSGTWQDERVALGSRRLSVIDLSLAGHMPMSNEDGSIHIVYNGEVYNFQTLRERFKLDAHGHQFRSRTDTEVLVHLYEEMGPDMAQHLDGMFAFAIWDARRDELHLARDRFGIKPLFYQRDADWFRFGSEIKAILVDSRVQRRVCLQALHDFLSFNYIPGEQTAFEGIYELPPAHWMTVRADGRISRRRYWQASYYPDPSLAEGKVIDTARDLMAQAVERQLIADVPIGVLLSGGMDSSSLVALMQRATNEPIHTYSVGFESASFNELPYARIVAEHFGTVRREVVVTPTLVRDLLPKYLSYIDEPYADGSAIPTYYVCQLAKDEVVVVLSGEGGDEVFAGYETYAAYNVSRWFRRVPRAVRQNALAPAVNRLPVSHSKLSLEFKLKRLVAGQDLPPADAHLWWRIVLTEARKREVYSAQALDHFDPQPSIRLFHAAFAEACADDDLSRLFAIDSTIFLPDDLMIKNDRMSMAHSLEARVPMTDNDLVEFMGHVPTTLKMKNGRLKYVMRQAMTGILPREIINKKKVGLEMPYSHWLRFELNDLMLTYLASGRVQETGLFQPAAIQALVDEHMARRHDHGRVLWALLNFMMWLDLYQPQAL